MKREATMKELFIFLTFLSVYSTREEDPDWFKDLTGSATMKEVFIFLSFLSVYSTREEDPDWFKDLTGSATSKEEYMFKSCQARIRSETIFFFLTVSYTSRSLS
jgi:DNA fragmentation factor 40 kDa